jgi:predicted amino acid racemase
MYLDAIAKRNPALVRAGVMLHQSGAIPANTYVIDLDTVRRNAEAMVKEAKRVGISLYFMSKHFNRNPLVAHTVLAAGIPAAVAVDVQDAQYLHRFNVPIGHVGHLVQIPKHSLKSVLTMRPEVMTIFSVAKARQVSDVATELGMVQDILLRVRAKNDIIYPNEEGGIWEHDLDAAAQELATLKGVRIVGVVTFPATGYNPKTKRQEAAPNFATIRRAAARLKQLGFEIKQVNAPAASSTVGFETVARNGGTHAEPGHALIGTTPAVLYDENAPETPAMIYVSEVSHLFEDKAYVFGGGFYACDTTANVGDDTDFHGLTPWVCRAFVGRSPEDIFNTKVPVDIGSFFGRTINATDYYGGTLCPTGPTDIQVGDTAIYGFRAQVFTTRGQVAVIDHVDSTPRLLGLFDRSNNLMDDMGAPLEDSTRRVKELLRSVAYR